VAIDFDGVGAWEWASKLLLGIADKHELVVDHQGDFHRGELGRSIYIGSKTSPVRAVVYEKGKQIPEIGLPNLVRIELRVRPKGRESGLLVCQMRPEAMYGAAKWAVDLGAYLQSENTLERVTIGTRWTKSDAARAISAMVRQYGGHLGQLAGDLGGWEEVGLHLQQLILQAAEDKNRMLEDIAKVRRGESILPTKAQVTELIG
jgi:DNA relaxase NicK